MFNQEGERAMRNRTGLLIVGIVVLVLLATGGTVGAMALTHSGFIGSGYNSGMMNGEPGYQGMMSGQYNHGSVMGGYRQNRAKPGAPVTGVTHMNMQNFAYQYTDMQVRVGTT